MGTTTMSIASITPPTKDRNRGRVIGVDGKTLGIFPEKLHLIEIGQTYDITHTDGQYPNIQTAVLVVQSRPAPQQQPAPLRAVRAAPQPTYAASGLPPASAAGTKDEQIFVMCGLKEFIRAGAVDPEAASVARTINMLRSAWASTFGAPESGAYRASDIARQARG